MKRAYWTVGEYSNIWEVGGEYIIFHAGEKKCTVHTFPFANLFSHAPFFEKERKQKT